MFLIVQHRQNKITHKHGCHSSVDPWVINIILKMSLILVYKETSSVDVGLLVLLSKNFFLWIQCPKILLLLFKDGADLMMDSFSYKHSLHTLSFGAKGFTFFTISHLILKLMFLFFNFQKKKINKYIYICCYT